MSSLAVTTSPSTKSVRGGCKGVEQSSAGIGAAGLPCLQAGDGLPQHHDRCRLAQHCAWGGARWEGWQPASRCSGSPPRTRRSPPRPRRSRVQACTARLPGSPALCSAQSVCWMQPGQPCSYVQGQSCTSASARSSTCPNTGTACEERGVVAGVGGEMQWGQADQALQHLVRPQDGKPSAGPGLHSRLGHGCSRPMPPPHRCSQADAAWVLVVNQESLGLVPGVIRAVALCSHEPARDGGRGHGPRPARRSKARRFHEPPSLPPLPNQSKPQPCSCGHAGERRCSDSPAPMSLALHSRNSGKTFRMACEAPCTPSLNPKPVTRWAARHGDPQLRAGHRRHGRTAPGRCLHSALPPLPATSAPVEPAPRSSPGPHSPAFRTCSRTHTGSRM